MNKKVELILNELIKQYLKIKEPISSTLLKELGNLEISPSTIRGYFQSLEKMGLIQKEHISSGSYPSIYAMKNFWIYNFPENIEIDLEKLKSLSEKFDITVIAKIFENQMLVNIYNLNNKFIVLEFENDEAVIKYSEEIYNFLKSLINLYVKDLEKLFERYKLNLLLKKIKNFQKELNFNEKLLYNKFDNINLDFLNQINNMKFIDDILIKKFKIYEKQKEIEIYIIGDIYTDFLSLFDSMKGGENEQKKAKKT